MINVRAIALEILNEIYANDAYANLVLTKYLQKYELSDLDRRFLTELVYGTVKAGDTLLWMLQQFSKKKVEKLDPVVVNILRLGIYQLIYMDKVPASAACNESTKLAKKFLHQGAGNFVNAVMRNLLRNRAKVELPNGNKAVDIALREQHPLWLVKYFIQKLSSMGALQLCQFDNTNAPLIVRTNTLKCTRSEAITALTALGCNCQEMTMTPEGIVILDHPSINSLTPISSGMVQIQDISSMLVAHVLRPQAGDLVIDCCAAPGGKSTHLAALMHNEGRIIASDIHEHKLKLIEDNAQRLGISIIETELLDARKIGEEYAEMADAVLVDAPCSGLGVLRRKVDARWHKSLAEIKELPKLQLAILESAAQAVKAGGVLVYSTCTIIRDENDDVVQAFLTKHPEFELQPINDYLPYKRQDDSMTLQLLPHKDNCDGFYIARMIRRK